MSDFVDGLLMKVAGRGYGWYLALKVGKAMGLPLWVAGWMVYAVVGGAFVFVGGCVTAAKETALVIARDFLANVVRPRWFSGFSRAYYKSLSHYRACVPYKVEDRP